MRIIAGALGGRIFDSPAGHRTHPMSDKMRGALFNALGDIENLTILDVFAGSGALSFEAISRGAATATAIDIDKSAVSAIAANARSLGVPDKVKSIRAGLVSWLGTTEGQTYDIILADPPYDDLQLSAIQQLRGRIKPNGLLVLSWPGKETPPNLDGLELLQSHEYGDGQLVFYRNNL